MPSEKCSCAAIMISSTGPASRLQPAAMGLYKEVKTKVKKFETQKKFKQIVHLLIKKSKTIYKNNNNLFLTGGKLSSWKVLKRYYDNDKVKISIIFIPIANPKNSNLMHYRFIQM